MSILCPRCHQGSVDQYLVTATGEQLLVCDECEAAWPDDRLDMTAFSQLTVLLADRGLTPMWAELQLLDRDEDGP